MVKEKGKEKIWDKGSVASLRRHLGWTQRQMAGEMGIRQQTVSEWEQGIYQPRGTSVTLLNIIAERAGFEYAVKTGEKDDEPAKNPEF